MLIDREYFASATTRMARAALLEGVLAGQAREEQREFASYWEQGRSKFDNLRERGMIYMALIDYREPIAGIWVTNPFSSSFFREFHEISIILRNLIRYFRTHVGQTSADQGNWEVRRYHHVRDIFDLAHICHGAVFAWVW